MANLTDPKAFNPLENEYENSQNESNKRELDKPYKKSKYPQCYYSDTVGDYICDAITNTRYPWKVGSLDERRFFKVKDTTQRNYYTGLTPRTMFYESPYAYINHMHIDDFDQEQIKEWYDRVNLLYPKEENNLDN